MVFCKPGGLNLSQRDLDRDSRSWYLKNNVSTVKIISIVWKNDVLTVEIFLTVWKNDISTVEIFLTFWKNDLSTVKIILTVWKNDVSTEKIFLTVLKNNVSTVKIIWTVWKMASWLSRYSWQFEKQRLNKSLRSVFPKVSISLDFWQGLNRESQSQLLF